jgi:hypothetical protein
MSILMPLGQLSKQPQELQIVAPNNKKAFTSLDGEFKQVPSLRGTLVPRPDFQCGRMQSCTEYWDEASRNTIFMMVE